jgi:uncharacterized protein
MLVILIMGAAFFIEACFGFGGGLIAVPFLSLLMPPQDAVYLMLVFQCLKAVLLFSVWHDIQWHVLKLMPLGIIIGLLIGTNILAATSPNLLRLLLSFYLLLFVACDQLKLSWRGLRLQAATGSFIAGLSGGIISGVTGMGGPALVTYCRTLGLDKKTFRATLIAIVTIVNFFRLMLDYDAMLQSAAVRDYTLPCLGIFALAMLFGSRLTQVLSETVFKRSITGLLLISALLLLYRGLGYW